VETEEKALKKVEVCSISEPFFLQRNQVNTVEKQNLCPVKNSLIQL
ncbi:MAG: hypothetical protein JWQ84_2427, partial [Mucilaginibacter sp.]|nr:hypothetical protein [Mucilaginibacter sp.]